LRIIVVARRENYAKQDVSNGAAVDDGGIVPGGAEAADIACSNGVIHVIDTVLIPK
jgi:hypothetical protein